MLTREDINNTENLAKLKLKEKEKENIKIYMEDILKYVEVLKDINIDNIIINNNETLEIEDLREDIVEESLETKEVLKNAISTKNNFFTIPNYKSVVNQNNII